MQAASAVKLVQLQREMGIPTLISHLYIESNPRSLIGVIGCYSISGGIPVVKQALFYFVRVSPLYTFGNSPSRKKIPHVVRVLFHKNCPSF